LVLVPAVSAQDKATDEQVSVAEEQYQQLVDQVERAQTEFRIAHRWAKDDKEQQKALAAEFRTRLHGYCGRLLDLAGKYPKDPVAILSLTYVVTNTSGSQADRAIAILLKSYGAELGNICDELAASASPAAEKLLRGILDKVPDPQVQAQACFSLAQLLKEKSESPDRKPDEAKKLTQEAEGLLVRVVEKYADMDKLVDRARRELFELRNLAIGKKAPEIEGEDIDGRRFKLSDYRGKVVVLDFWGHW
jgi:hypothetical protein